MSDVARKCPRCGREDTIKAWKADVFKGFVAGCVKCYRDDVDAWAVAGAVPIVFAPTERLALEKWNAVHDRAPRRDTP